jgi:hypothetical protein
VGALAAGASVAVGLAVDQSYRHAVADCVDMVCAPLDLAPLQITSGVLLAAGAVALVAGVVVLAVARRAPRTVAWVGRF